jgi:hypothetical protein
MQCEIAKEKARVNTHDLAGEDIATVKLDSSCKISPPSD